MTRWAHTCHARIGVRVEDFAPKLTTVDVPLKVPLGIESFDEDAGFNGLGTDIVPYNCSVTLNNYTSANTAKLQIPFSRLPIDPRVIVQMQVQIFGGVLTNEEVQVRARLGGAGQGSEMFVGWDVDPFSGNSYELFRGFAQTIKVSRGKDDYMEISAVDLTAIFTTAELYADPLRGIPKTARIDEVIRLLIYGDGIPVKEASRRFGLPGARGTIIVNETGASLPRLMDIHPPEAFDSKGGARKSRSAGSTKKVKFWDIINELCKAAGLWPYVRAGRKPVLLGDGRRILPGAELVITNPRTFYAAADAQRSDQPGVRKFIDGDNIDGYEIERRFEGGDAPTCIEVRSLDPVIRKTRFARYPRAPLVNRRTVSGKGERQEIEVFVRAPLTGPEATNILCQTAISLYEHRSRNELEVTVSSETTMSALRENPYMNSDGSWNTEVADMFFMRPGDPFEMDVAPPDPVASLASSRLIFADLSREKRIEYYRDTAMSDRLAQGIAVADESPFVQRFFRTVRIEWSWAYPDDSAGEEGGWSWTVIGKSYMDVRNAPQVLTDLCLTGIGRGGGKAK